MSVDTIIKNCRIFNHNEMLEAGIAISEGKIAGIMKDSLLPAAHQTINANGNVVIPGLVDPHVHAWDPGWEHREDWVSMTRCAAAGGVTTVIEHGTSMPQPFTKSGYEFKINRAGERAVVDFALHSGSAGELKDASAAEREVDSIISEGALGFKMYMTESVPELQPVDDLSLYSMFKILGKKKAIAMLHCENNLVLTLRERFKSEGKNDPIYHPLSRPSIAEIEATGRAILLAEQANCTSYIVHMTAPGAVALVKRAKMAGQPVMAETCPQYLFLDDSAYEKNRLGPYVRMCPPLRSKTEVERMWSYIYDGTIGAIGTDHCVYPNKEKEVGWDNIWRAGNGIPALETMLPLLLDSVNRGRLSLFKLVELCCYNPARIFGLYPTKGTIQVGADADITIIDMRKEVTIKSGILNKYRKVEANTPYDGWKIKGVPIRSFVRGQLVMDNGYPGEVISEPGFGKFYKCQMKAASIR